MAYIQIILITPHRNWVSRKYTMAVDKIKLIPMQKIMVHNKLKGKSKIANVKRTPVISATMNKGIIERRRLMAEDRTFETGKIYFGI